MAPYFLRSTSRAQSGKSSSTSYGILHRKSKTFVLVNAEFTDNVDVIINISTNHENPNSLRITPMVIYNEEEINSMLFDNDSPYKVFRLIYTSNNGSLVTSGFVAYSPCGQVIDYVMKKKDYKRSIWFAKVVLHFNRIHDDAPKSLRDAVNIRRLGKRKLEEEEDQADICVICQEKYQAGHMIGDLPCKHSFHVKCIKKWLNKESKKKSCPTCRANVFKFNV